LFFKNAIEKEAKMNLFILSISLLASVQAGFAEESRSGVMGYSEIGREYLSGFGAVEAVQAPQDGQPVVFEKITTLSGQQKRQIAFDLFERTAQSVGAEHVPFPVQTLAHDLNVFCFHSKDAQQRGNSLCEKINKTQSVCGEVELCYLLAKPTAHTAVLQQRQQLIAALVNKQELRSTCREAVKEVAHKESELFSCFAEPSKIERDQVNRVFFTQNFLKSLNQNELVMKTVSGVKNAFVLFPLAMDKVLGVFMGYGMEQALMKYANPEAVALIRAQSKTFWGHVKFQGKALVDEFNPLSYKKRYDDQVAAGAPVMAVKVGMVLGSAYTAYKIYVTYKSVKDAATLNEINKHLQRKLLGCAAVVRAFDALVEQAKHEPALGALYAQWESTAAPLSPQFQQLLGMLRTRTFTGDPSFFSQTGRVQAAYSIMQETKNEFASLMRFIGQVDAYCGLAELYEQENARGNVWSFVTYIDQEAPLIQAVGFRNPMITRTIPVPNDIMLGGSALTDPRAAVVTGSNSGGKSTIMITGLTSVLYLAQTVGMVPAVSFTMTPFDYFATSLKVQDNIATGVSHFVAETKHAASLANVLTQLPATAKVFFAIDELFEGTTAEVGSTSLYKFAKELLNDTRLLFVVVTQYQSHPTHLERESNGLCRNYKVDVIIREDGKIERPYKVEPGISTVSIGDQLLQEAFAA